MNASGCPLCPSSAGPALAEELDEGAFYRCPSCRLEYVDPVPSGAPLFQDFSASGESLLQSVDEGMPLAPALTPNERAVLRRLERDLPAQSAVLELCCESGRFLAMLRHRRFRALGMDPLPGPVRMLRRRGFDVEAGLVEEVPAAWPTPAAVVLLESLVRFPKPLELLQAVRRRFPNAVLYLTAPSPRRSLKLPQFDRRLDYPPDHLTRWSPLALRRLLEQAGYRAKVTRIFVTLHVWRGRFRNRVLKMIFWTLLRLWGELDYSIMAVGRTR